MTTGQAIFDADFAKDWWASNLAAFAPIAPFPTEAALAHQLAAFERMANEENKIAPDPALLSEAVQTICSIPLSLRAYRLLLSDPMVSDIADWVPAAVVGPNGIKVLIRRSEKTLRNGIDGAFTYRGFQDAIIPLVPEIAAQAELDRTLFAGGCAESSDASSGSLENDILKLYYDDFIAQWDGFLRDVTLAPMPDLATATANLKDLATADSALKRLLNAVVLETELTRVEATEAAGGPPPGLLNKVLGKLGKLGKLAKKSQKLVAASGSSATPGFLPGQQVADHFKGLKGVVAEVDGQPPALDAVVVALSALFNELQTVSASPDPEGALLARGGLAELTGSVANQTALLPDPIDDWLAGIAGDTIGFTEEAVVSELNAIWRADVLPSCKGFLSGRYPFAAGSSIDVNQADFATVFQPGGLIDAFTTDKLGPYIDTTQKPWAWRADFGLDASSLAPFEKARTIRDGLFPGGAGPIMGFTLEAKALASTAARVTLNVDGQELVFANAGAKPVPMTWPGKDGTNVITISFVPTDGSGEKAASETGSWAWLRMISNGRLKPTNQPDLYNLRIGGAGFAADFELRASSVNNPFDLKMFGGFSCPEKL